MMFFHARGGNERLLPVFDPKSTTSAAAKTPPRLSDAVTKEELYALALLERDPRRIVDGIDQLSPSDAEMDLIACIRAYGHLARRFRYFDRERTRTIVARGRRIGSGLVESVIADLAEDLSIYVDEEI